MNIIHDIKFAIFEIMLITMFTLAGHLMGDLSRGFKLGVIAALGFLIVFFINYLFAREASKSWRSGGKS